MNVKFQYSDMMTEEIFGENKTILRFSYPSMNCDAGINLFW